MLELISKPFKCKYGGYAYVHTHENRNGYIDTFATQCKDDGDSPFYFLPAIYEHLIAQDIEIAKRNHEELIQKYMEAKK